MLWHKSNKNVQEIFGKTLKLSWTKGKLSMFTDEKTNTVEVSFLLQLLLSSQWKSLQDSSHNLTNELYNSNGRVRHNHHQNNLKQKNKGRCPLNSKILIHYRSMILYLQCKKFLNSENNFFPLFNSFSSNIWHDLIWGHLSFTGNLTQRNYSYTSLRKQHAWVQDTA